MPRLCMSDTVDWRGMDSGRQLRGMLPWLMRVLVIAVLAAIPSPGAETISGPWIPVGISSTLNFFLDDPLGVAVDGLGNVYISEVHRHRVLKVDTTGMITRFAGTGWTGAGGDGGPASQAQLDSPLGMAIDGHGNVYIADSGNHRVRKVDVAGTITTFAGTGGRWDSRGYSGDGGPATSAKLNQPSSVAVDGLGNVYIADTANDRVRKVDAAGIITTYAGTGERGYGGDGGPAVSAKLHSHDVAVDGQGNLYILGHNRVRKVDAAGIITTFAGGGSGWEEGGSATSVSLNDLHGLAVDGLGNVYITKWSSSYSSRSGYYYYSNQVLRVDPAGTITTFAGIGSGGYSGDGGPAVSAELRSPEGVAADGLGNIYIADYGNHRVRKVDAAGTISTFVGTDSRNIGDGGPATHARLVRPEGVALDALGNVYIADENNHRVRKVDAAGTITTFAGTGEQGFLGDGWPASQAKLSYPKGVAVDRLGNVYIADTRNHRVRKVDAAGTITTFAGTGETGYLGDGEPATWARLYYPESLAVDGQGNVYIADTFNHRVRKVDAAGTIYTRTVEGWYAGGDEPYTSISLNYPGGVAVDGQGNVYIADTLNHRVRKVDAAGTITTFAGTGSRGSTGDGAPATRARLYYPRDVAVDGLGNVYIADTANDRVRKVDAAGIITTYAGTGERGYGGDGGPATRAYLSNPEDVAVDALGYVYIADTENDRVRRVDASGTITTFAGALNPTSYNGGSTGGSGTGPSPPVATPLALDQSLGGRIETAMEADYFLLELSETTDVAIYTTGTLATKGTLLDSTKTRVLASDSGSQGTNFRIEATVEAGEYYVKVESYGTGTGVYTLHVRRRAVVANAYGMEFELVPKGTFQMGSTSSEADPDEQPVRRVTISQPFYMAKHEVTQGQWKAVMGADSNPSKSRICDTCPVDYVSWNEALEFIGRLNEALGTTVYRLPTEAEWEYAARAGEKGERYAPLNEIAWHKGNSGGTTQPVGEKRANAFGLHDMLGNVWEWVQDWHGSYEAGPDTDPTGPATGLERARRGGSWYSAAEACRLPSRYASVPSHRASNLGLRLVMTHAVTADPAARPIDDHGNSFSTATELAIGDSVDGYLGDKVEEYLKYLDIDFFRLDLTDKTSKTDLLIYTTGSTNTEGTLWVEGATERLVGRVGSFGADGFVIEASLDPGIYFVRVRPALFGKGGYTLHVRQKKPTAVTNAIGMEFVQVSAGEFKMGSNSREAHRREKPVTQVEISQPFYMGKYEVTQEQWNDVMGEDTNPSVLKNCGDCPVDSVTWDQAQEFVKRLNGKLPPNNLEKYRLPTEAEWEYAARAGTTEDRYAGDLAQIAWYGENSDGATHPVGQRLPNRFGLYDMLGNVSEWVLDWSGGKYTGVTVANPVGPRTGRTRVLRGCSSYDSFDRCRTPGRASGPPEAVRSGTGFRLVLKVPLAEYVLDDHPNTTNEPSGVNSYEMPSAGAFELDGDFASGDDVDYLRLEVFEPISATASVRLRGTSELASVRLGRWSSSAEVGFSERCLFNPPNYSAGSSVTLDLEPGWYCVMAKPNSGNGGAYRLVIRPSSQSHQPVDLTETPSGDISVVVGYGSVGNSEDQLKFGPSRIEPANNGARIFQLPEVAEKTRVAIYIQSDNDVKMRLEGKMADYSYLPDDKNNYPIVIDLEDEPRHVSLEGGGEQYTLHVQQVRAVREEAFFRNLLGMEFMKLPDSAKLNKDPLNFNFQMGSEEFWNPLHRDWPPPEVYPKPGNRGIDSFWMGRHEVTQCQWSWLMQRPVADVDDQGSITLNSMTLAEVREFCKNDPDGTKPVVNVTFKDAVKFVEQLNALLDPSGYKYRLPKEAEWEYAAQAGVEGEWHGKIDDIAWHEGNSRGEGEEPTAKAVGSLLPNAFGLHDMLGNVAEWVADDYQRGNRVSELARRIFQSDLTWTVVSAMLTAGSVIGAGPSAGTSVAIAVFAAHYISKVSDANEAKTLRGGGFTSPAKRIGSSLRNRGAIEPKEIAAPGDWSNWLKEWGEDSVKTSIRDTTIGVELGRSLGLLRNLKQYGLNFARWTQDIGRRFPVYLDESKPDKVTFFAGLAVDAFGLIPTLEEATRSPTIGFRVAIEGNDPSPLDHFNYPARGDVDSVDDFVDDHSDRCSSGEATQIRLGESKKGKISTDTDDDCFHLKLDEKTTIEVYTTGIVDTQATVSDNSLGYLVRTDGAVPRKVLPDSRSVSFLRDSDDWTLPTENDRERWGDWAGDDRNFWIKMTLYPGDYFVSVEGRWESSNIGPYVLHVKKIEGGSPIRNEWLGMEFASVPPGEFMMGSTYKLGYKHIYSGEYPEAPLTHVKISSEFEMGKHEVTQEQWRTVMDCGGQFGVKGPDNPSYNENCDDCPVEGVSWDDVQNFLKVLNGLEGTTRYRLPTEAEWEYAARGAPRTILTDKMVEIWDWDKDDEDQRQRYYEDRLDDHNKWYRENGWYSNNSSNSSNGQPQPVGSKQHEPNPLGLYDMMGNVSEWVQDLFGPYLGETQEDPVGPEESVSSAYNYRTHRGQDFSTHRNLIRVTYRDFNSQDERSERIGFRLARDVVPDEPGQPTLPCDDHSDDNKHNATEIKLGESAIGKIGTVKDVDLFYFKVDGETLVTIYTTGPLDTEGSVLKFSDESEIASNFNWGEGGNFRIEQTLGAGDYLVKVSLQDRDTGPYYTGAYELHVDVVADDHGNDRVNPTQLTLGQSQAGRIETDDDVDFFIFSVDRQTTVAVYTTGTLDTEGRVLYFDGNQVARNRNSGAGRNFRIEQTLGAGVYFVEVWSNRGATGAYELHVETVAGSGP